MSERQTRNIPMMKCGHAANAVKYGTDIPVCCMCHGIKAGWDEVDNKTPNLENRIARCSYYNSHRCGQTETPSSVDLPFFQHRPEMEYDSYYCGCWGFD